MTDDQLFPAPVNNHESALFYEAAAQGKFMIRRCDTCHRAHWYPRTRCPFCSSVTSWVEASGRATLYSFSSMSDSAGTKTIAYVTLEEGPSMMTSIVDCNASDLSIGQHLRLVFKRSADPSAPVPCFSPVTVEERQ